MNISKRRILMNAFFKSQFTYCPLVWMSHSRPNSGKINRPHERFLRIIYSDKESSFETLLEKDDSVSLHNRNLQILATEMYKMNNNLSLLIVAELSQFTIPPIRTVYHWSKSISFLGPKICSTLPHGLKNANSIEAFKMQIRKWKPENCPCRLYKVYVRNVGFVQENFYRRK